MQQPLAFFTRIQENGQPLPAENLRKVFISYKRSDDPSGVLKSNTIEAILKCMDVAIDMYEPSRSPGPGNAVFLNYDPENQALQVLESDFDHYTVETDYCEYTYRNIFENEIQRDSAYVGSHKYASILPCWIRRWDHSFESEVSKRLFVPSKG